MTQGEIAAYNRGVALIGALAAQSAAAMRAREIEKPTRFAFAVEALQAVADEAAALVLPRTESRSGQKT